jgi:hypothetical protein
VLLWFWGTSLVAVWVVFHDPTMDYRLVLFGAIVPDLIDAPFGGTAVGHSVTASVAVLLVVVLATVGHRARRRRLLALPIGMFLHLVFDGAFTDARAFWWPLSGLSFADEPLPSVARGWWDLGLELAGAAMIGWAWRRFCLHDRQRRRQFGRCGTLTPC